MKGLFQCRLSWKETNANTARHSLCASFRELAKIHVYIAVSLSLDEQIAMVERAYGPALMEFRAMCMSERLAGGESRDSSEDLDGEHIFRV